MQGSKVIYEGKAKQLLATRDPDVLIQHFKDEATAFNGEKFAIFEGKGALNNAISCHLFEQLAAAQITSHYLGKVDETRMKVRRLEIIPLEIVVRNIAAGSLSKRIGWEEGRVLPAPIVETYYKKDALGDPILANAHVHLLGLATQGELELLTQAALSINDVLRALFADASLDLVDFKLEFGRDAHGKITLGDEISPDTCRLWDTQSGARHDKDVFRRDLAELVPRYAEVARRLGALP